jgi:precorrin-8X/cobalt-precorrin-8 methylmutase
MIDPMDATGRTDPAEAIHPIEVESYRRIATRVDLSHLESGPRAVIARVIHATADIEFAESLRVTPAAVATGIEVIATGAPVVVDVEMVGAGIGSLEADCFLSRARAEPPDGLTLSARAMRLAAGEYPDGALFVIGCAPTALEQLLDLVEAGAVRPGLVVGVPVGFVGAAEAKDRLRCHEHVPSISNLGERGGSSVAAAIVNALVRLSKQAGQSL